MTANFSLIFAVVAVYVTAGFGLSVILQRNDVADVLWGPGIFLASAMAAYSSYTASPSHRLVDLICLLVFLWALRITWHIGNRFVAKNAEDPRYAHWRQTWTHFYLRSYFQVFLLQGLLMIAVSMVVIAPTYYRDAPGTNLWLIGLGTVGFVFALMYETLADLQLNTFLKADRKPDEFLQTGLWAYSRHPNYFGEIMVWWSLFIIALAPVASANAIPVVLAALVSPLTITFLLLKVSGIPLLEARRQRDPSFQLYKKRVSALIPWFRSSGLNANAAERRDI
jgi:steroid 5-alpha reductase family enzyme